MILPERTVDAWTAAYITGRWWHAQLWAPAERRPLERYDLAVAGPPTPAPRRSGAGRSRPLPVFDKVFVLEHKGLSEQRRPIQINLRQLLRHLSADRAAGGKLIYYLLPTPGWTKPIAAPYGTIPAYALDRTGLNGRPSFQTWAITVPVEELFKYIRGVAAVQPKRVITLQQGKDAAIHLAESEVKRIQEALSLQRFITEVEKCARGIPVSKLRGGAPRELELGGESFDPWGTDPMPSPQSWSDGAVAREYANVIARHEPDSAEFDAQLEVRESVTAFRVWNEEE